MATNGRKTKGSSARERTDDWQGFVTALSMPAGVSAKDRRELYRRGRTDAQHGRVAVNEFEELSSPFCEQLVQSANQRIMLEWHKCNKRSYAALLGVNRADMTIDDINRRMVEATTAKDEGLDAVHAQSHSGDAIVSEYLKNRRTRHREKPVLDRFNATMAALESEKHDELAKRIAYAHDISRFEEEATSREMFVRTDYLWRLSVYAYGAASYMKISPDMINDSALSDGPREEHERLFDKATQFVEENSRQG